MLDIKFIRENPDLVKAAVKNKKAKVDVDQLLKLDEHRRGLIGKIEELNREKNAAAKEKDIAKGKQIKDALLGLDAEFKDADAKFFEAMYAVPNIPSGHTPVGPDESGNRVIKQVGQPPKFGFEPKEHWQLGEQLGIIDIETATKVTGSRFAYLKGDLALLQFAIIQFLMQALTSEQHLGEIIKHAGLKVSAKPFVPVLPPVMIKPEIMQRMGRLEPRDERYYIASDDLYLIGSAEHTLGPMHMDQAISEEQLPLRYIGYSTAFRREAGSYGKDMKGILRVHQFDKLEMESFTAPELSEQEQLLMVAVQEYLMGALELPYQVVEICTGDMGAPDYRQIDIETWMPGQNKYRETHTADLMTDFQSRRLNIKVKRADGKSELLHMNDATASAGRTMIAIMENYQQADGSIKVPKALLPYMFGITEIKKR